MKANEIIEKFDKFFQQIRKCFIMEKTSNEKWTEIADLFEKNSDIFLNIYNIEINKDIGIDFSSDFDSIVNNISIEKDNTRKLTFIIAGLHYIIYNLMTVEPNYLFTLNGKEQMAGIPDDINYYISISEKIEQNIYFHSFILLFGIESLFVKNLYVCIDFEFTDNKIRLAQLNFEHHIDERSMIIIINPAELTNTMMDNFIMLIMCNPNIKKILHGSDSKDTPYVYDEMLDGDPDKIIAFTRTLIDTKLLCDYYKLNRTDVTDNRCSIYSEDPDSSAIYYFSLISKEQQDRLATVLDKMPVDITWNIRKLTNAQKLYAQYDVIYLKYFYYRMINLATKDGETDAKKANIMVLYRKILPQITQFAYLESKEITSLVNRCKSEVDPLNNFFYFRNTNEQIKLVDTFNRLSVGLIYDKYDVKLDNLLQVSYFKKKIQFILKRIIYGHMTNICIIYQNKSKRWTQPLSDNNFIPDVLYQIGLDYLANLFYDINKKLGILIRAECGKK